MLQTYLLKVEAQEIDCRSMANMLLQRMIDQFNQTSFEFINSSSKMRILNLLKDKPGRETYLCEVTNSKHRAAMTKLRLSSHSLEIEKGRYDKTEPQDRLCCYCLALHTREVEDKVHFLINCPQYKELRDTYLSPHILKNNLISNEEKFIQTMTDNNNVRSIAKFISQALEDRETSLEVLNTIHDMIEYTEKYSMTPPPVVPKNNTDRSKTMSVHSPDNNSYRIKKTSKDGLKITLARISA